MLPADTRVTEIALTVADLAGQVRFYTRVLGLDVVDEPPGSVRLGAGDHAFLRLDERRGAAPAATITTWPSTPGRRAARHLRPKGPWA